MDYPSGRGRAQDNSFYNFLGNPYADRWRRNDRFENFLGNPDIWRDRRDNRFNNVLGNPDIWRRNDRFENFLSNPSVYRWRDNRFNNFLGNERVYRGRWDASPSPRPALSQDRTPDEREPNLGGSRGDRPFAENRTPGEPGPKQRCHVMALKRR